MVGVVVVGVVVGLVVVTVVVRVSVDVVVSSPPLSARAARVPTRAPPMKRIAPTTAAAASFLPSTSEPLGFPRFWGARGPLARLRITRASLAWRLVARGRPDIRLDEPVVLRREGPSGEPTPAHVTKVLPRSEGAICGRTRGHGTSGAQTADRRACMRAGGARSRVQAPKEAANLLCAGATTRSAPQV